MGQRIDMPGFPNNSPAQWRSTSVSACANRDGSADIRVTIGGTYMGATVETDEVEELAKFLTDLAAWTAQKQQAPDA